MLLKSLPIILSLFLAGCLTTKPDAFLCTFIKKDPIENSYSYCVNAKTQEEKEVPVENMSKWITGSPDDYEAFRQWYKSECKPK